MRTNAVDSGIFSCTRTRATILRLSSLTTSGPLTRSSHRWWFEEKGGNAWITRECDHLVPYGWGVRSALAFYENSGSRSGNMLSYFKAFQWMNDFGVMNELESS